MKIEKIPYQFFFPVFEAYKSIKFHFRLGTIPHKTGDWGKERCDVNKGTLVSWFLYSSVVFRVQRKKIVWTKIWMGLLNTQNETTEE